MTRLADFSGQRFGRLVVKVRAPNRGRRVAWLCQCDCGGTATVTGRDLKAGTRSCGCLSRELTAQRSVSHGHLRNGRRSKEWKAWSGAKRRCTNPCDPAYEAYGGRGIRMSDEWCNSFEAFYAHMGPKPSPTHSLDRIDNERGYEPGNCRWATKGEQARNRRRPRRKHEDPRVSEQ